jgi:hypothetical protein
MASEERGTVWIVSKVEGTQASMSHILHGRLPLTEKLAHGLQVKRRMPLTDNHHGKPLHSDGMKWMRVQGKQRAET